MKRVLLVVALVMAMGGEAEASVGACATEVTLPFFSCREFTAHKQMREWVIPHSDSEMAFYFKNAAGETIDTRPPHNEPCYELSHLALRLQMRFCTGEKPLLRYSAERPTHFLFFYG